MTDVKNRRRYTIVKKLALERIPITQGRHCCSPTLKGLGDRERFHVSLPYNKRQNDCSVRLIFISVLYKYSFVLKHPVNSLT